MNEHLPPGTWAVLATPFHSDGTLDLGSLAREVAAFTTPGVVGLVALGVFGEAARLTELERAEVVRTVLSETDLPVVVGLPGLTAEQVAVQTDTVLDAAPRRPRALMVQVPFAEASSSIVNLMAVHLRSGLPVVVQDYPVASGVIVSTPLLRSIVQGLGDVVAAVKAESPPTSAAIAELVPYVDAPVFGGLGGVGLLDELAAGAAGAMTGFSHPEAISATVAAHRAEGSAAARRVWAPWLPLANFEGQTRIGLALRKEVLRRRGIFADAAVRPPAPGVPSALLPLLEDHLANPDLRSSPWISA